MIVAFFTGSVYSALLAERLGSSIPKLSLPEQLVSSSVDVMNFGQKSALPSTGTEPAVALEEFSAALAALRGESGEGHYNAAKMLQRICENAAENPDEEKYRRIRCGNSAFKKHLDRFEASRACLTTVGFRQETSAEGEPQLVLPRAHVCRPLLSAVSARLKGELRMLDVQKSWPAPLRAQLPAAAASLALRPALFEQLTQELTAPHVGQLLEHGDNTNRVTEQLLRGEESAHALVEQLREVRENVTAAQAAPSNPAPAAGPSRVKKVTTPEEWYDLLLEAPGLVVAYFGAKWCKPCQMVKPLYATLSANPKFGDVTFAQIDTDELPTVSSECEVASLPTFKFFKDATEDDVPVVGADIMQLESRIEQAMVD